MIHFRLAELKSEVEALRSLVYRACEEYLAGNDVTMLASMAKLKAGRLRREVSDACLQYWGGAGYLWDNPVARSYRDGRLGSIGGGADEVMLQIISKLMGTLPRLGQSLMEVKKMVSSRAKRGTFDWRRERSLTAFGMTPSALRRPAPKHRARSRRRDVQFTQEHDEIRRTLRAIIDKDINPHVDQWEDDGIFPAHEVFKKLGDAGLLGINKPVEFGGMGLDYSYAMVMAEELGHINCGSVPMAIGVQTDMATPALARYGSDELRTRVPGARRSPATTSPASASPKSARARTSPRSRRRPAAIGGDCVINGGKMWTTNGTQADWMCLLASTGEGAVHKNKSLICVPMKTKGVQVVKKLDKLGMRSSDTAQIFFDEVKVPVRNIIGQEGMGFVYQMQQFQEERLWGAISAVVGMERLIDQTVGVHARAQGVRPAAARQPGDPFQARRVAHRGRAGALAAATAPARIISTARTSRMLASMAKLKAGRMMRLVTDGCLQYWGGAGYLWESPTARAFRDSRLASIGGGADEVMLQIISKLMGTLPRLETDNRTGPRHPRRVLHRKIHAPWSGALASSPKELA